jgi:histone H3/H4
MDALEAIMMESTVVALCRSYPDKYEIKRKAMNLHTKMSDSMFEDLFELAQSKLKQDRRPSTQLKEEEKIKYYMDANLPLYAIRILMREMTGINKQEFDQILEKWERYIDKDYETYKTRQKIFDLAMDSVTEITLPSEFRNNHYKTTEITEKIKPFDLESIRYASLDRYDN